MATDEPRPYRLVYSAVVRSKVQSLIQQLLEEGVEKSALADDLRHIENGLSDRPHEVGEPHFRLGPLRWLISFCFGTYFGFEYTALDEPHVVIIRRVFLARNPSG